MKRLLAFVLLTASCFAQFVASPGAISAPTSSPGAGTYSVTQSVTLSAVSGSYVCYTTDGSTPTGGATGCSNGTHYTGGAISVAATTTIKAKAFKAYYLPSSLLSDTYTISGGGGHPAVFTGVTHVWHMSEAANSTRSDSVGTDNLTDTSSNIGVATGLLHANAAHYLGNGTQKLGLGSTVTLSPNTNWSYCQWYKPTDGYVRLFGGSDSTTFQEAGGTYFSLQDTAATGSTVTGLTITDSTWHLICLVGTPVSGDATHEHVVGYLDGTSIGQFGFDNTYTTFNINQVGTISNTEDHIYDMGDAFMWLGTAISGSDATTLWNSGSGLDY